MKQEVPPLPAPPPPTCGVAAVKSGELFGGAGGERRGGEGICDASSPPRVGAMTSLPSSLLFFLVLFFEITPACTNVPSATSRVSITALRQAAAALS